MFLTANEPGFLSDTDLEANVMKEFIAAGLLPGMDLPTLSQGLF